MTSYTFVSITALLAELAFWLGLGICPGLSAQRARGRAWESLPAPPQAEGHFYTGTAQIRAKLLREDFVPDGDTSKKIWKQARWIEFSHDMAGRHVYPDAQTRVAAAWTERFVYFAFQSSFTSLNLFEGEDLAKEKLQLWDRDVAEVFINPEPLRLDHYYEFEVAPDNRWVDLEIDKNKTPFNDAAWNSGFEHATRIDAKRHTWTCEMRIPVAALMATQLQSGAEWRVNFFRADGPGDDDHRRFLAWSPIPEGKTFHVPARFGVLRFTE
jgi:hypothetical protein